MPYTIEIRKNAIKKTIKYLRKNKALKKYFDKAVNTMMLDPFHASLNTHKVVSRLYGEQYSSRITGDLRFIWNFKEDSIEVLLILDVGGHDGAKSVY